MVCGPTGSCWRPTSASSKGSICAQCGRGCTSWSACRCASRMATDRPRASSYAGCEQEETTMASGIEFGVIGLGRMGGGLTLQALDRGMRVVGLEHRTPHAELVEAGMSVAHTLSELRDS